ncbi:hypothetical protein [Parasedimentitalea psychrophila]|uniref:Uncharacterized protein n=1 Tax=Parasedimentitalea psychrophila TaxID=2997337 RepID=A0A9Y2P599_9RHOB|nr:hypothetical protein [Parasedimentitalea psychrophila]WIY23355.1 hypothetical protein QPJ95_11830 [Parasedimentitalea psychrophila]
MQRPIVTIPAGFLQLLEVDWDIDWRGQPPGNDTGGGTSVVYNRFPRWIGSPSILLQGDGIAQWRAIRAQAQGRVGIYRLPMVDPVGFVSSALTGGTSFEGGATFASGTGFAAEPACFAAAGAAAGAVQIRVENAEVAPVIGQIMSHKLWPFTVTWVSEVSAGVYELGIQMPLRAAIAAGDTIKLQGEGLFEAVEDSMGRAGYDLDLVARPRLNFREVLNR